MIYIKSVTESPSNIETRDLIYNINNSYLTTSILINYYYVIQARGHFKWPSYYRQMKMEFRNVVFNAARDGKLRRLKVRQAVVFGSFWIYFDCCFNCYVFSFAIFWIDISFSIWDYFWSVCNFWKFDFWKFDFLKPLNFFEFFSTPLI